MFVENRRVFGLAFFDVIGMARAMPGMLINVDPDDRFCPR